MDLIKNNWTKKDLLAFNQYLESLSNPTKILWTKKIVNTKMHVLAIPNPVLRKISKEIAKGNFLSFLDIIDYEYYESTIVVAYLLSYIQDFKILKNYLDNHSKYLDNWSSVDTIKLDIKGLEEEYFKLAKTYINSPKPFKRRLGIVMLFWFDKSYYQKIYEIINNSYSETEYYVNMAYAWLMCELLIKDYHNSLSFFKIANINQFVYNKTISKCMDSYRLTEKEKVTLRALRK